MAMTLLSQTYSFLYFDKMKIKQIQHCQNSSKIQYTNCRKKQNRYTTHKYMTANFPNLVQVLKLKVAGLN